MSGCCKSWNSQGISSLEFPSFIPKKLTRSVCSWAAWLEKSLGDCWHSWQTWEIWEKKEQIPNFWHFDAFLCSKSCSLHPSWMQGLAPILDKTEAGRRGKGISSHSSHIPAGLEWFPPPSGIYSHRSILKCSRFSRKSGIKPSKIWDWGGFQETESIPIPSRDWMIQSQEGFPGFWNYWKI